MINSQCLVDGALVVQVDGQDSVPAMGQVMSQQRGDGALADAALRVAQNKCLHAELPPRRTPGFAGDGAPTRVVGALVACRAPAVGSARCGAGFAMTFSKKSSRDWEIKGVAAGTGEGAHVAPGVMRLRAT